MTSLKIPSLVVFQAKPKRAGASEVTDLETRSRHVKEGLLAVITALLHSRHTATFGISKLLGKIYECVPYLTS